MDNKRVRNRVRYRILRKKNRPSVALTDMDVWKVGMELVKEVYRLTNKLPQHELYGLTAQLRRASTSILANLAEGYSRSSPPDKAHKYTISRGECSEVKACLLICTELGYFKREEMERAITLSEQEGQLFSGLIRAYSPTEPALPSEPEPQPEPE